MEYRIHLCIDGQPNEPDRAFGGTTFFYVAAKVRGDAAAPVTLRLTDRTLLLVLNGKTGSQWIFADGQEPLDIPPFAFFAALIPAGVIDVQLEKGTSAIHCIGFSEPAIQLLAEEFEGYADLVAVAADADGSEVCYLPHRFLPPTIYKYLDRLHKTDKQGFALNIHRKEALYQAAKLYHTYLMTAAPRRSAIQDEELLHRAEELIQLHFADPLFNIDRLAEQVGLSRRNLYRLFENQGKPTPQKLILTTRLEKARELRQTTDHPVSEIAGMVGFSVRTHFSKQYKQEFGISPQRDA